MRVNCISTQWKCEHGKKKWGFTHLGGPGVEYRMQLQEPVWETPVLASVQACGECTVLFPVATRGQQSIVLTCCVWSPEVKVGHFL